MREDSHLHFSRRERQIMDVIFEQGECSASDIQKKLPNPPSYSAVRAMLSKLEKKGSLSHREEGTKYIFFPVTDKAVASQSAARRLVRTFFGGAPLDAVNTLLNMEDEQLSHDDVEKLEAMVAQAKLRSEQNDD